MVDKANKYYFNIFPDISFKLTKEKKNENKRKQTTLKNLEMAHFLVHCAHVLILERNKSIAYTREFQN